MKRKIRLLPVLMVFVAFAAMLKLSNVVQGVEHLAGAQTAQSDATAEKAKEPKPEGDRNPAAAGETKGNQGEGKTKPADGGQSTATAKDDGSKPRANWIDPASMTDAELDVLHKLSERRKLLESRAGELEMREQLLKATEKRVDTKIGELKKIQVTINGLLKRHDAEKDRQMKSVVKIYENMKPKSAARIFERLEMSVLLDVMERMREAKSASIMAKMSPVKAKSVTSALAKRRALPRVEQKNRR